jgi:hypothetical protein
VREPPVLGAGAHGETLSPAHEIGQDLLTIVHCFSRRLKGLRNYRKKLKEALQADAPRTPDSPEPDA